jgi:hypothetical protein
MKRLLPAGFILLLLASCATETPQTPPQIVSVYSTSAAAPWLDRLYACAGNSIVLSRTADPASADISLHIGETEFPPSFIYQIGEEEILIVVHPDNPIQTLTAEEAQALFAGLGNPPVQVWVYPSDEDVFRVFDQFVMKGRSVSPSAKVAVDPAQMSDALTVEAGAVGILPRSWLTASLREVYSVAKVPVLVITQREPQGAVGWLIDCLQK